MPVARSTVALLMAASGGLGCPTLAHLESIWVRHHSCGYCFINSTLLKCYRFMTSVFTSKRKNRHLPAAFGMIEPMADWCLGWFCQASDLGWVGWTYQASDRDMVISGRAMGIDNGELGFEKRDRCTNVLYFKFHTDARRECMLDMIQVLGVVGDLWGVCCSAIFHLGCAGVTHPPWFGSWACDGCKKAM